MKISLQSLSRTYFVFVPMSRYFQKTQFYDHILHWKIKQGTKVAPAHFYYQNKIKSNISVTCLLVMSALTHYLLTLCNNPKSLSSLLFTA